MPSWPAQSTPSAFRQAVARLIKGATWSSDSRAPNSRSCPFRRQMVGFSRRRTGLTRSGASPSWLCWASMQQVGPIRAPVFIRFLPLANRLTSGPWAKPKTSRIKHQRSKRMFRVTLDKLVTASFIGLAFAGCTTTGRTPIVAGAVDDVGITAGLGAQSQGGNLTIGFRGAKFAVVPVQTSSGERLTLANGSQQKEKSFSVFALLGVDAAGGLSPGVDVRQVVAVGPAADIWAEGSSGVSKADLDAAIKSGQIQK